MRKVRIAEKSVVRHYVDFVLCGNSAGEALIEAPLPECAVPLVIRNRESNKWAGGKDEEFSISSYREIDGELVTEDGVSFQTRRVRIPTPLFRTFYLGGNVREITEEEIEKFVDLWQWAKGNKRHISLENQEMIQIERTVGHHSHGMLEGRTHQTIVSSFRDHDVLVDDRGAVVDRGDSAHWVERRQTLRKILEEKAAAYEDRSS